MLRSREATAGSELEEEEESLTLREAACQEMHSTHQLPSAFTSDAHYSNFAYLAESEELMEATLTEIPGNPRTLTQARSHFNWPQWQEAMDHEILTLEKARTWITVP